MVELGSVAYVFAMIGLLAVGAAIGSEAVILLGAWGIVVLWGVVIWSAIRHGYGGGGNVSGRGS